MVNAFPTLVAGFRGNAAFIIMGMLKDPRKIPQGNAIRPAPSLENSAPHYWM
jgi:hypothetical protein